MIPILRFHRFYRCLFARGQSNDILLRHAELKLRWNNGFESARAYHIISMDLTTFFAPVF